MTFQEVFTGIMSGVTTSFVTPVVLFPMIGWWVIVGAPILFIVCWYMFFMNFEKHA